MFYNIFDIYKSVLVKGCLKYLCVLTLSARIPKLKTVATAPFPTPATVFPKPQP